MHRERLTAYSAVSTRLSLLSDHRLRALTAAATPLGSGIGGRSAELDVDGTRVFVKRVPLTDIELLARNVRSTANLFGLPLHYQYGVGSAGFGAWRELAAHAMTTGWVIEGAYDGFPLMYHWRVLPDSPPGGDGIDAAVARWEGSDAVRRRLEAIGRASYSLVLFLEHVPHRLGAWLAGHPAYDRADRALLRGAEFMSSRGLVHFDAHFHNVLTDGELIHFADFGLALSTRFELAPDEARFLSEHLGYDRAYTASHLLRYHLPGADERDDLAHEAFLREWIAGRGRGGVPAEAAALLDRHAATGLLMAGFHRRLVTESKRTPFPAAEVAEASR
ncbi:protein kinase family protein [Streptomyces sp. NBC_01443]|uniref:protein kinase family protein n=1 Tax=Streptomyces sp. NBC_01443 TaxID=2903868 RepID=UPI00224E6C0B|nr:protein kinase family protein [Streptomyces sp. NBC_01443]MCX4628017.1 protein kinase family protein [Streptomyces sp. NBC_01443]